MNATKKTVAKTRALIKLSATLSGLVLVCATVATHAAPQSQSNSKSIISHTTSADTVLEPGLEVTLPAFSSGEPGAEARGAAGASAKSGGKKAASRQSLGDGGAKIGAETVSTASTSASTASGDAASSDKTISDNSKPSPTLLADMKRQGHKLSWRNMYVRVGAGWTMYDRFKKVQGKLDHHSYYSKAPKYAPLYTVGIGYKFIDAIRADLNFYYGVVDYRFKNEDAQLSQKTKVTGVMLNAYYYLPAYNKLSYYMTVGGGFGANTVGDLRNTRSASLIHKGVNKRGFIWNAGAGVNVDLLKNVGVDFGYRYINLGSVGINDVNSTFGGGGTEKIKGHQALLSLLYNFA